MEHKAFSVALTDATKLFLIVETNLLLVIVAAFFVVKTLGLRIKLHQAERLGFNMD